MRYRRLNRDIQSVGMLLAALVAIILCGEAIGQVTNLEAFNRAGQTFLTWQEVNPPITSDNITTQQLLTICANQGQQQKIQYRVYASDAPITSVAGLTPIAEVSQLTGWNADFYGISPKATDPALRYVIKEGADPVAPGTAVFVRNPDKPGNEYYAVTVVTNGVETTMLGPTSALQLPVMETVGQGIPVLQRIERPASFTYVSNPTLNYYVRWESPPNSAVAGKPFDYLVAQPPNMADPAPVGIHMHGWGSNLSNVGGGYSWWYNAEKGSILVASNQVPYDWWTGYNEQMLNGPKNQQAWQQAVVRPYAQTRLLSFLDWVGTQWDIDRTRTFTAGISMGGSGSIMMAIRHPDKIAWGVSWVGVHNPAESPTFKSSYENAFGPPEWEVKFEDGTPVWDYYNDALYLRQHPKAEIGLLTFSNGKNDSAIGWQQAVDFYQAIQDTKRPHVFVWGQAGHGQRAKFPVTLSDRWNSLDLRTDQSQPAFTHCSLDDNPGNGDPNDGDPSGQINLYLYWRTEDIVDNADRWEMTVGLIDAAPKDQATVDVTPRRLQLFSPSPGSYIEWTNMSLDGIQILETGRSLVDENGLFTLENVIVGKQGNRLEVSHVPEPSTAILASVCLASAAAWWHRRRVRLSQVTAADRQEGSFPVAKGNGRQ